MNRWILHHESPSCLLDRTPFQSLNRSSLVSHAFFEEDFFPIEISEKGRRTLWPRVFLSNPFSPQCPPKLVVIGLIYQKQRQSSHSFLIIDNIRDGNIQRVLSQHEMYISFDNNVPVSSLWFSPLLPTYLSIPKIFPCHLNSQTSADRNVIRATCSSFAHKIHSSFKTRLGTFKNFKM